MANQVLITNIQRYSLNDGPGIRTTVFLKGCALRCRWCHNPECIDGGVQIYYKQSLCRQCGRCFEACRKGAVQPPIAPGDGSEDLYYHKIDLSKCDTCLACVEACPFDALVRVGELKTVEEVLAEVERDWPFYTTSGGGMTVTGGEPAAFPDFTLELLGAAKERGLHACLDTSGFCDWGVLDALRGCVDIFLYDLKNLDDRAHRRETGVGNELILQNLEKLAGTDATIHLRIPVVPGFNESAEHMRGVAQLVEELGPAVAQVDLLPFHNWCQDKYRWLGLEWSTAYGESMNDYEVEDLRDILEVTGITTTVGG